MAQEIIVNGVLTKYIPDDNQTSATISDQVTSIGPGAFYGCRNLETINLPEGITRIGVSAFQGCIKLARINLPDSITSIGSDAFNCCERLTKINLPMRLTSLSDGILERCRELSEVTFPEGLTSIGTRVLFKCGSLDNVTLPEGITSIRDGAFERCGTSTLTVPAAFDINLLKNSSLNKNVTIVRLPPKPSVFRTVLGALKNMFNLQDIPDINDANRTNNDDPHVNPAKLRDMRSRMAKERCGDRSLASNECLFSLQEYNDDSELHAKVDNDIANAKRIF